MWPWNILLDLLTDKWGWLLVLTIGSCIGFIGMTVAQFIKCLVTKNTVSLNKFFTIILPITNTLITIYDLIIFFTLSFQESPDYGKTFEWMALFPAILNGLISAYGTMILKIKHMLAAKKHGMTELAYYKKYLKPIARSTKKELARKKIHQ